MVGVQNNDVAAVNRVLQYDNVDRKNFNVNGSLDDSLLHIATSNNNLQICEMLVKFGADVNMFDFEDLTPLGVAERNTNYSICKLLLKKRKRKERRISYKKTLHICVRKDDLIDCKKHINSVNVNETDERERTPLHVAVIFASDKLCQLLLKQGADVNAKDSYNDSPIQLAFYYGRHILRDTSSGPGVLRINLGIWKSTSYQTVSLSVLLQSLCFKKECTFFNFADI